MGRVSHGFRVIGYSVGMAKRAQVPPQSFEEALKELEEILAVIEAGEIGLEQNLEKYERGMFLIQHCRSVLASAEKQVEMLAKGSEGNLESTPLEEG